MLWYIYNTYGQDNASDLIHQFKDSEVQQQMDIIIKMCSLH